MHTGGIWRLECVSDAARVVVGHGRSKIILARLAPKQLPEAETVGNARLMRSAPKLLEACKMALAAFELNWQINWDDLRRAIEEAEGTSNGAEQAQEPHAGGNG